MAKFNKQTKSTKTTNLAGGEAFSESPELELVSILLTSFVQDQFYRSENEGLDQLANLISTVKDKKFAAKAAIFARQEFGMRSVTHATAAELAHIVKGEPWTKDFYERVVSRVDDITEILSYYLNKYKKPIPNSLKKGLAKALRKFDTYQLAKYRAEGKAVSLTDAINLIHPKPSEDMQETYKKLMAGELKSKHTWETKMTQAGQKAETKEEKKELKEKAWTELLKEKRLGYFALLRNLRNILEQAPELVDEAVEQLTNREAIKRSKVLPFRFSTALQAIETTSFSGSSKVVSALSKALDIAVDNVPELPGKTLVVLDESGSMRGLTFGTPVDKDPFVIGSLFASVLFKSCESDLMLFAGGARYLTLNKNDSTLTLVERLRKEFDGGSTNFHSIFKEADKPYDRIIILSDMQGWVGITNPSADFNEYKQRTACDPKVFSFDLQGYGTLMFPERNVYTLAGFSEKIFDVMKLLEQDRKALLKKIEEIEL